MQTPLINIVFFFLGFLLSGCIERYTLPPTLTTNNHLVVDGFINAGSGPTTFTLSRTRILSDTTKPILEPNALLSVESENGEVYPLNEINKGTYSVDNLNLNPSSKYRLRIRTNDSKEYLSAFVPIVPTPAIDSITWTPTNNGVQIYVNTHDSNNNTWFYKWDFQETYEYHAAFYSILEYKDNTIVSRAPENRFFTCWQTESSNNLLIGTSTQLSEDILYQHPLIIIPSSIKLSIKYSILVKQYSISKEGFEYWQLLKKNTETTGSIFDAQPSQLTGNITCVNNPQEPVIGFISASSVQEKRIFINRSQLPLNISYDDYSYCQEDTIRSRLDELHTYLINNYIVPVNPVFSERNPLQYETFTGTDEYCADCRERGGTTIKPDFWQ